MKVGLYAIMNLNRKDEKKVWIDFRKQNGENFENFFSRPNILYPYG